MGAIGPAGIVLPPFSPGFSRAYYVRNLQMFIYTISDIMQLLSALAVIGLLAWLRIDKYLRGRDDRE